MNLEPQSIELSSDIPENRYPECALPKNKMLCYISCIPKHLHPYEVQTSIQTFDQIITCIYSGALWTCMIIYHSTVIGWTCLCYNILAKFLICYIAALKIQWFGWFHDDVLKKRLKCWLYLRTFWYLLAIGPSMWQCSLIFWDAIRLVQDTGENLELEAIQEILAFLMQSGFIGIMSYFCLLGFFTQTAADCMYREKDSIVQHIIRNADGDYMERRALKIEEQRIRKKIQDRIDQEYVMNAL